MNTLFIYPSLGHLGIVIPCVGDIETHIKMQPRLSSQLL